MSKEPQTSTRMESVFQGLLYLAVLLLVLFMCMNYALPLYDRATEDEIVEELPDDPLIREENRAVREARQATASADRLLSFLEGASVLVALALGAAAIFGFQNARDLRREQEVTAKETQETLREFSKEQAETSRQAQEKISQITPYIDQLARLSALEKTLDEKIVQVETDLNENINDVALLLQSYLEFGGNKNFDQAYIFAKEVTEGTNPTALGLYMAGWLEIHRISQNDAKIIEKGLKKIEQARELVQKQGLIWYTLEAAYGVGLRRLALQQSGDARRMNLSQARMILLEVLKATPNLLDFNQESFWGPVGGISRDLGHIDDAIAEYGMALQVTPGSSYPLGNLATLYLEKASRFNDEKALAEAVSYFKKAVKGATDELIYSPHGYFQMMDVAMGLMMIAKSPEEFGIAHTRLAETLNLTSNASSLEVSLRGWFRLLRFCPPDWKAVQENIVMAIETVLAKADCPWLQEWLQNWQGQLKDGSYEPDMLPAMNMMIGAIEKTLRNKGCG